MKVHEYNPGKMLEFRTIEGLDVAYPLMRKPNLHVKRTSAEIGKCGGVVTT